MKYSLGGFEAQRYIRSSGAGSCDHGSAGIRRVVKMEEDLMRAVHEFRNRLVRRR